MRRNETDDLTGAVIKYLDAIREKGTPEQKQLLTAQQQLLNVREELRRRIEADFVWLYYNTTSLAGHLANISSDSEIEVASPAWSAPLPGGEEISPLVGELLGSRYIRWSEAHDFAKISMHADSDYGKARVILGCIFEEKLLSQLVVNMDFKNQSVDIKVNIEDRAPQSMMDANNQLTQITFGENLKAQSGRAEFAQSVVQFARVNLKHELERRLERGFV